MASRNCDEQINARFKKTNADEACEHTSSKKWLSYHGLKKLKLDFARILSSVGFKNSEEYVKILKKPVTSKYGDGLFTKVPHKDGNIYNITVTKTSLIKIEKKLQNAVELYKRRLEWLTSSSRKYFGVIEEGNLCFIIDIADESEELFQRYIQCITTMFKEQLIFAQKFNILRVGEDINKWSDYCVEVSSDSIISAIDWLLEQNNHVEYSITSVLQTILEASVDSQIEGLYICTNGGLCTSTKQLIMEKVKTLQIPVHVIHIGSSCSSSDVEYLTELAQSTGGRFHVSPLSGGIYDIGNEQEERFDPQRVGVRPDVMLIWEELDDARTILTELQSVIASISDDKGLPVLNENHPARKTEEVDYNNLYISSKDWLKKYGLKKLNLTLQSFLKSSTFDHSCGILDIKQPIVTGEGRAQSKSAFVDAKYCDKFAHLHCSDGTVKHVQFSESMYREYVEKMDKTLKMYRKRLDWLQNGSRELFGTIIENKVCILIDTSSSMRSRLHLVQEKLMNLFQEQLINKEEFNIINFGSRIGVWKDILVTCNSQNLHDAEIWVRSLEASGSTNTFTAIKTAYSMDGVEALYLLTDGRPDQPGEMILSQVSPSIPIHCISFNCADDEANQFLCTLAARSGGRYHQFCDELVSETLKPSPFASEDLSLIRAEITKGIGYMKSMSELREECHSKQVSREHIQKANKRFYKRAPSWTCQPAPYSGRHMNELGYLENRTSLLRSNTVDVVSRVSSDSGNKSIEEVVNDKVKAKIKRKKKKNAAGSGIKGWVKKNGLIAQQLTIFDALGPTIVEQKGKYVPSLGKEVMSKVYGEATTNHSNSGKEREFKVVNPQAVNMTGYQQNLKEFLEMAESKLDSFIFGYLSDDAKEEYKGDGISSCAYLANKSEIVAYLDERGLSKVIKDGKLLEKEIKQGKLFLQQSSELEELIAKLKGDAKIRSKEIQSKQTATKTHNIDNNNSTRMRYHRVLARSDIDGYYYPAVVHKYVNPRYVNVIFDNGEKQLTSVRYIIPLGGSTACPTLSVGDYVLVKSSHHGDTNVNIENEQNACFVPGIIQVTPLRMASASKYYTVVCYDGTKLTVVRKDMFKITRSRFVFCVRFIQEVDDQKLPYSQRESFTAILHRDKSDAKSESHSGSVSNKSLTSAGHRDKSDSKSESRSGSVSDKSSDVNDVNKISVSDISDNDNDDNCIVESKVTSDLVNLTSDGDSKVDVITTKFEEWKEHLQTDYDHKMNEIKEQKSALIELEERLKMNEDKQQQQQVLLQKQCEDLQIAKERFLERQIKQKDADQENLKNEYRDLSEMQMEIYKRQQEQQEQLIKNLLEKQEKYDDQQSALLKIVHMKDEQTEVVPEDVQTTDAELNEVLPQPNPSQDTIGEEPEIKMFVAPGSEAILMAQGDSGVYVSRAPLHEDPAVVVRKLPLKVNQEVLARFKDEGWYYRGTIYKVISSNMYVIQDGVGDLEEVCGEDILFDEDDATNVIRISDHAVGLHPKYQYAYAPGLVTGIEIDGALKIQFYDGQVAVVPRVEAYLISQPKYESDCSYLRDRENALIGQAVVCRDNKTGVFHLGAVVDHLNGPRNYLIEWPSHTLDIQNYAFIFGSHTKRQKFEKDGYVLAISNLETYAYLPGQIVECNNDETLKVKFCDDSVCDQVKGAQSFWLSSDYHSNAVKYWQDRNSGLSPPHT